MATVHIPEVNALFLHLPKTAGLSVSTALAEGFETARWLPVRGLRRPHGAARHMARQLGQQIFATAFSFCFVRNPWDWTVSGWKHVTQNQDAYGGAGPDFATFVTGDWRAGLTRNPNRLKFATPELFVAFHAKITQWEHLGIGRLRPRPAPLAFYGRFERLEEDWGRICDRIGRDIPLTHANRSSTSHYTEYYDDRLRGIVAERNAPLIARFGYRFGA